jgi:hypothetical protein
LKRSVFEAVGIVAYYFSPREMVIKTARLPFRYFFVQYAEKGNPRLYGIGCEEGGRL